MPDIDPKTLHKGKILRFPDVDVVSTAKKGGGSTQVHPRVTFISYTWQAAKPTLEKTKMITTDSTSATTLYLPNGFSEKYSAKWSETQLATSLIDVKVKGNIYDANKDAFGTNVAQGIQDAASTLWGGLVNSAIYATGTTAFPGQFNVFQKADPITMEFTFDLLPRNSGEAALIESICSNFKEKLLPSYGDLNPSGIKQFMLTFPDVWHIYFNGINGVGFPGMDNSYKDMALTSVNVTYSGGENSALTFEDGYAVLTTLALGFTGIKHSYKR